MKWMAVVVLAFVVALGAGVASAKPSSCRPQKFCNSSPPPTPTPDPCDTGGVGGKTVAETFWDGDIVSTGAFNGIAGDPKGNWGPVSGAIEGAGGGSTAATEAACVVNSAPWGSPL